MKWLKFRIETTEEAEDILISDLYDCGLEGAQIEDKQPLSALDKERMFVDILPDVLPDDGKAYLSFFVEAPAGDEEKKNLTDETLAKIKEVLDDNAAFFDIGSGKVEISETEDIDWINNWKQYFHQFYVDDILVIPSWETASEEDTAYRSGYCFRNRNARDYPALYQTVKEICEQQYDTAGRGNRKRYSWNPFPYVRCKKGDGNRSG